VIRVFKRSAQAVAMLASQACQVSLSGLPCERRTGTTVPHILLYLLSGHGLELEKFSVVAEKRKPSILIHFRG